MSLDDTLKSIGEHLRGGHYHKEEPIRVQVVTRVLDELGWATTDPQSVVLEYTTEEGRADVALFTDGADAPKVIIEVKRPDKKIDDQKQVRQLLRYCYDQGVQMALLTNGRWWNFHLPGEGGDSKRLVQSIDLVKDPARLASILERYLDRKRQRSGEAVRDARKDYEGLKNKKQVEKNLPKIWFDMLATPLASLVDLVAKEYERIHGNQPDPKLIEEHIKLFARPEAPSVFGEASATPSPTAHRKARPGDIVWRVDSSSGSEKNGRQAFVKFFEALYESIGDANFEKLSTSMKGRKKRLLARDRLDLHVSGQEGVQSIVAKRLRNGWWLNAHSRNRGKCRKVEKIQKVLESELDIKLHLEFRVVE